MRKGTLFIFLLIAASLQASADCVVQSTITASPMPVNGKYARGTVVTFCYTVVEYDQQYSNWFHGVELNFGAGWDPNSILMTSVASTCGNSGGSWGFFTSVTSTANGFTYGPGFFFDEDNNGNPGDNSGDDCILGNWTFCWTAIVDTNPVGTDLTMTATPLGDSQSGSWTSEGCGNDTPDSLVATIALCRYPNISITAPGCAPGCDGAVVVTSAENNYPYSYLWNTGSTDSFLTGLCSGTYFLTMTDDTGCVSVAAVIIEPEDMVAYIGGMNVSCQGMQDGKAWVVNATGTPPFTYEWNTQPPQYDDTISNLKAGYYAVTVTNGRGCTDSGSVMIAPADSIFLKMGSRNCDTIRNGEAWVTATGGTKPYFDYTWNTTPVQTSDTVQGLMAGTYVVTVADTNGCVVTDSVWVPTSSVVNLTFGADSASCGNTRDGKVWVDVTGIDPASYWWITSPRQGGDTAYNVPAGNVQVFVADSNGCFYSEQTHVPGPPKIIITANINPTCPYTNDGFIELEVTGGAAPYSYNWPGMPWTTGDTAANLPFGWYPATVTDSAGCSVSDTFLINKHPDSPIRVYGLNDPYCVQQNIFVVMSFDPSGGIVTGPGVDESNFNPSVAGVGTHTLVYQLTDQYGCTATKSFTVRVNACVGIDEVPALGDVSIYPNPTNGLVYISFNGITSQEVSLKIFNVQGQLMHQEQLNGMAGSQTKQLDMSSFAEGVYLVKLESAGQTFIGRVVLQ